MSSRLGAVLRVGGTALELGLEVAPALCDALDREGPGGRNITADEALELGMAVARAVVHRRGDRHAQSKLSDMVDEVGELFAGRS